MSGGRQGEESNQLLPPPAQVAHPAWFLPCLNKGAHPCKRGQIMLSLLPFPGGSLASTKPSQGTLSLQPELNRAQP